MSPRCWTRRSARSQPREPRARGGRVARAGGVAGQAGSQGRPGPEAQDPFRALGLEPRADLTDDEVHAAWRRTASATHPDREDGGDLGRFADAAAAYTLLRTRFSRGEALADRPGRRAEAPGLAGRALGRRALGRRILGRRALGRRALGRRILGRRILDGRPGRLAARVLAAAAASVVAVAAAGPHPAAPALVAGIATWLVLTARHDLAPPR
jgi:hypothetical protein